jgi:chromosome segregation ATPase
MVESENCKLRNALYDAAASFLIICQQAERIEDSDDASEIRHLASSSHQSAIEAIESPREVFAQRIAQLERENAALRGAIDAATTSLCTISQHYREKVEKLERENAALREAGHLAEKIIVQRTDEIRHLERENDALRHSEENLAATVRGLEFELEKAEKTAPWLGGTVEALGDANDRLTIEISGLRKDKERLDWLNTHCMSADPIMGRSTYRWTIEHDEPDIRAAIAELRKAQV